MPLSPRRSSWRRALVGATAAAAVWVGGSAAALAQPVDAGSSDRPPVGTVGAASVDQADVDARYAEYLDLLVTRDTVARLAFTGGATERPADTYDAYLDLLEADIAQRAAELGLVNGGPAMGIGPAVFPVVADWEYVDSWGAARSGGRRHKGTDILAPRGTPVVAIESGVVERFSNHALGGIAVYLRGDSGSLYYYAHLDELGPQAEGDRVAVGEIVGTVGTTGNTGGLPHLHFQWAPDGDTWVNPYPLLQAVETSRWTPPGPDEVPSGPSLTELRGPVDDTATGTGTGPGTGTD